MKYQLRSEFQVVNDFIDFVSTALNPSISTLHTTLEGGVSI
jgi:hypothetical protein